MATPTITAHTKNNSILKVPNDGHTNIHGTSENNRIFKGSQ
jgi:hypothetical protein